MAVALDWGLIVPVIKRPISFRCQVAAWGKRSGRPRANEKAGA